MTFNQPSSQQTNPQQEGGYSFGDTNFSEQPQQPYGFGGGYSYPQPIPQRKTGRRNCLLLLGCSAIAIVIVCGCLFGMGFLFREVIVATIWIQVASDENSLNFQEVYDLELICPNSQADRFTQAFQARYPEGVTISLTNDGQLNAENGIVTVTGTFTDRRTNEVEPYEAVFYITHDDGPPILGCIERIEQISPPFNTSPLG
ncbi:MAG: hypothetical protein CUN55_09320 [Phototrophicales bacterium]|nr:MAG: hypothetical protein CUN55_09320 [Phototrophicales bacterium]